MPKTRPPYAPEFRQHMVDLVRTGRAPKELAREFEPSAQAIRNWVAKADSDTGRSGDGLTSAEPRSAHARDRGLVSSPANAIGRNGSHSASLAGRPDRRAAPAGPEERVETEQDSGSLIADRQDKRRKGTEGGKRVGITAAHQRSEAITDALVAVEDEILPTPSAMSAHDEEYSLDSFLAKEGQQSAPRRWLAGLISLMGLAAFVGFAWYVYKPNLDIIPDLSIPAVFASAAPVAKTMASTGDVAVAPIEVWVAAPIEDPAALHTNSDKVDNLSVASLTQPQLLRLRTPFMRGPDVTALQQALAAKDIAIDVDGVYGSATEAAVIAFQKREGLTPNGIIGPDTRSRLQ